MQEDLAGAAPAARLWAVDAVRGLAVLVMLAANTRFDLGLFHCLPPVQAGPWWWLARATACLFLLVAGVSLALSRRRAAAQAQGFAHYRRRGLRLLAWAILVSLATRLALGDLYVRFGALHLIGLGVILCYPLLGRTRAPLFAALAAGGLGPWLGGQEVAGPWLLPLGVRYPGFASVDYQPILPWLAPMLAGLAAGNLVAARAPGLLQPGPAPFWGRPLAWLGRHSLVIYLGHQPALLGLFLLAGVLDPGSLPRPLAP
ncbi:MAG: heparan-alpha-glucosaminide N-acetyltransferase [Thermodesulfobacteriota bacterium]